MTFFNCFGFGLFIWGPSWPWSYGSWLTTTCIISAYHHWCCEFEYRSGLAVQHYVIMLASDLRQVDGFLHQYNWPPRYNWNIVESGVKHHQTNKRIYMVCFWVKYDNVILKMVIYIFKTGHRVNLLILVIDLHIVAYIYIFIVYI